MVQGLDRFNARWRKIPQMARKNVRAEMEDIANDITDEMWSRVLQGKTGVLGASIGWTWGDAPAGSMTIGTVGKAEYGTMRITIYAGGDEAFYAWFHEFGTVKMPANPFFFPVWRAEKRRVRSRISRAMSKAIRES